MLSIPVPSTNPILISRDPAPKRCCSPRASTHIFFFFAASSGNLPQNHVWSAEGFYLFIFFFFFFILSNTIRPVLHVGACPAAAARLAGTGGQGKGHGRETGHRQDTRCAPGRGHLEGK